MSRSRPRQSSYPSFYDYVGGQLSTLIPRFGLEQSRTQVLQSYATICSESLSYPFDQRAPGFSRINHDGTPFQFAVALGTPVPVLRFLSEATAVSSGAERIKRNRNCIAEVARILDCEKSLSSVTNLLYQIAPALDPELVADEAGAFWIGVGFASDQDAELTIYINAKWGSLENTWKRFRHFAAYFESEERWRRLEAKLSDEMQPLGMAITLSRTVVPAGRIYLSAYGKRVSWYEDLASSIGNVAFATNLRQYAEHVLGEDHLLPTPTSVASFGVGAGSALDFKFEMCGHCIFPNDVEAAHRLRSWVGSAGIDRGAYEKVLEVVSEGHLDESASLVHCYVGLGIKHSSSYSTVYLKPAVKFPAWSN